MMNNDRNLIRAQQYHDLAALDGPSPIEEALKAAEDALSGIRELQAHLAAGHQWSGDTGFCVSCGWDGNA